MALKMSHWIQLPEFGLQKEITFVCFSFIFYMDTNIVASLNAVGQYPLFIPYYLVNPLHEIILLRFGKPKLVFVTLFNVQSSVYI